MDHNRIVFEFDDNHICAARRLREGMSHAQFLDEFTPNGAATES